MIEFTFDSLFRTTNKGLPDTSNLPPYSYITMNHFVFSLLVEIILALVITIYTALAVYRAFYRIKNPKFNSQQKSQQEDEQNQQEQQENEKDKKDDQNEKQQASQTNDNLIYRFDDDESEKDGKDQKNSEQLQEQQDDQNKGKSEQENQHQQEQISEQTTEWFLDLDHKMLFFQPFLISFVVVVNIFASNIVVLILLGLGLLFFYLFNVKGYCGKKPILQIVFTLPCIVVLLMVYFEDRDMST